MNYISLKLDQYLDNVNNGFKKAVIFAAIIAITTIVSFIILKPTQYYYSSVVVQNRDGVKWRIAYTTTMDREKIIGEKLKELAKKLPQATFVKSAAVISVVIRQEESVPTLSFYPVSMVCLK